MTDEQPSTNVSNEGDQPATKADLDALARRLEAVVMGMEGIERQIATTIATKQELSAFKDEITRHFDVVAENIHQDVAAANRDELSLIKDQQLPDHEERIRRLERRTGLPVGVYRDAAEP